MTLSTSGMSTLGVAAIAIIVLIGSVVVAGVATNQISLTGGVPPCGAGTQWNGTECVARTPPVTPPVTGVLGNPTSALYKVGVTDLYGSALTATTGVDVIFQSNLDTRHDNVAPTHTSEAGAQALAAGDKLYFHVYSTAGNGYYDRWFRVNNLQVGAPVELMTPVWHDAQPIGSWGYSYTIIGNGVEYLAGATPYWIFPTFPIIQRSTAANVGYAAQWAGATTVSATGASSTTYTAGAAKYTATGPTFKMKFEISTAAVSTSIGEPMLVLTSTLPRQFSALFFVLWFSLNNTQCIDSDGPFQNGFHKVPFSSTVYSVYYKVINPVTSTQTSGGNRAEEISMNTAPVGGSVGISVLFWCTDLQSPPDVAGGASDNYPLPYGGMTAIGTGTALIDVNGFKYAAAVPTSECCYTIITTHA
jgi:hypothetical protein